MVLYHGPTTGVRDYLFSLGFVQPSLMDIADYLAQLVVSPSTAAALSTEEAAERGAPPITALTVGSLARAWQQRKATDEAAAQSKVAVTPIAAPSGSYVSKQYGRGTAQSFTKLGGLLLARQVKLTGRNKAVVVGKIMQSIVMGFIIGSVFYNTAQSDFISKIALSLFCCIFLAYSNMAELPVSRNAKAVVQRQLQSHWYPSANYVGSVMLLHLPVAIAGDVIFCTILYWLAAFASSGTRWIWFCFCGFAMDIAINSLFR